MIEDQSLGGTTYYQALCGETPSRNLISLNTAWFLVTCLDCLKHEPIPHLQLRPELQRYLKSKEPNANHPH